MAQALLPEDLWSLVAAHLPNYVRSPKGGRPRINDRAALTGILFVLKTGIPWDYLPRELGYSSGMTCWRRLHEWMELAFGSASMRRSSNGCANMTRSCGIELALTLPVCQPLQVGSIRAEIRPIVASSAANIICSWINVGCRW